MFSFSFMLLDRFCDNCVRIFLLVFRASVVPGTMTDVWKSTDNHFCKYCKERILSFMYPVHLHNFSRPLIVILAQHFANLDSDPT